MPEICRFFGIIIRMFFDDHHPPHIHTEYQGNKDRARNTLPNLGAKCMVDLVATIEWNRQA